MLQCMFYKDEILITKAWKEKMISYEFITEKFLKKISYLFDIFKMTISTLPKLLFLFTDNLTSIKKIPYVCGYANGHYFIFLYSSKLLINIKNFQCCFLYIDVSKKWKLLCFPGIQIRIVCFFVLPRSRKNKTKLNFTLVDSEISEKI
jgi:hypothetical protein